MISHSRSLLTTAQPPADRAASQSEMALCLTPLHPCPFLPLLPTTETCTGQDLADLGDRLRDWFQLLHENAKQNGSAGSGTSLAGSTDAACCAREGGGQWGGRCALGPPALCSLLPDPEPHEGPKPWNKGR